MSIVSRMGESLQDQKTDCEPCEGRSTHRLSGELSFAVSMNTDHFGFHCIVLDLGSILCWDATYFYFIGSFCCWTCAFS